MPERDDKSMAAEGQELISLAEALAAPASFRRGVVSPPPGELPNNMLVFLRKELVASSFGWMHNRFVLVACMTGEGEAVLNGIHVGLQACEALLIRPYQAHNFSTFGKEVRWLFITFELEPEGHELPAVGAAMALDGLSWTLLRHIVEQFLVETGSPGVGAYGLSLTLELLLSVLAKKAPCQGSGASAGAIRPEELLVERLNRYLQQHLGESANNASLARQLGVSCGKLRSNVRKIVGMSLGTYVRRVRIQMASSLMVNGQITVGEAAERCGFNSIYAFSRCFKHVTGMSPSAFAINYGGHR